MREAPPDVQPQGAPLDVSPWQFRKAVAISQPGVQQLELDLDVLSHAQPGFEDLRLMRGNEQVPYIIQHTTIQRALTPDVTITNDTHDPKTSRWILKLPRPALPVARLTCASRTPLFQRDLTAYEQLRDDRGDEYQHVLGHASWTQTRGSKKDFALTLDSTPQSDTLFLETQNGDNPPISLETIQLFYPATRVLFKAKSTGELSLYYGDPDAAPPHYDLSLIANELLAANRAEASLGKEEQFRKSSWRENRIPGKGGAVFWGILALVVVVLLVIISRLLPKSETHPPK